MKFLLLCRSLVARTTAVDTKKWNNQKMTFKTIFIPIARQQNTKWNETFFTMWKAPALINWSRWSHEWPNIFKTDLFVTIFFEFFFVSARYFLSSYLILNSEHTKSYFREFVFDPVWLCDAYTLDLIEFKTRAIRAQSGWARNRLRFGEKNYAEF